MSILLYKNIKNIDEIPKSSKRYLDNIDKYKDIKFIFATGRYLRYFKILYIRQYFENYKLPVTNLPAFTFEDFIMDVYKANIKNDKILLNDYSKHSLMELAFEKTEFKYYKLDNLPQSSLNKLTSLINGFEKEKIPIEELYKDSTGVTNQDKYFDILNLYENYLKLKGDKYFEITDAEIEITKLPEIKSNNDIYYFEYFNELRNPDKLFIDYLSKNGYQIVINLDYTEDVGPQFDSLHNTVSDLLEMDFTTKKVGETSSSELYKLKKGLFSSGNTAKMKTPINIIQSNSIGEEITNIIKLIKKLHFKKDVPLNDIYIYARNPQNYSDLVRFQFAEYGLPVNITDRFELDKSPLADSLLSLLKIPFNDFKVSNIKQIIKNPLFDFGFSDEQINNFIDYSSKRREKRISLGKINVYNIDSSKDDFHTISNYFFDLFKKLENLDKINPLDFIEFCKSIIKIVKIDQNIIIEKLPASEYEGFQQNRINERNTRALASFLNLLDSVAQVWNNVLQEKYYTYNFLFDRLRFLTKITKYQIRELYDNGVTFTSIEQARGIDKKISILCGATEGDFPLNYKTNSLIGKELPETEFKHYSNERNLFYQFLSNGAEFLEDGSKRIYISYSKPENSTEFNPCSYLGEIGDLFNINYINNNIFENIKLNKPQNGLAKLPKKQGELEFPNLSNDSKLLLSKISTSEFSSSSIEDYANNPYIYFAKRILRASTEDVFEDKLSPLERGNLLHKITERFYITLIEESDFKINGFQYASFEKNKIKEYRILVDTLVQEEIEKYRISDEFTKLNIDIDLGLKFTKNIFYHWLEMEAKYSDLFPNLKVLFLEKKFNTKLGNVSINGKIDRVDLLIEDNIKFFVYDYKSGSNTFSANKIASLESFQLPIYIFAMKEMLEDIMDSEVEFGGALYVALSENTDVLKDYYKLKLMNKSFENLTKSIYSKSIKYYSNEELNDFKIELIEAIEEIASSIGKGHFPINENADSSYELDKLIRDYSIF